MAVIGELGAAAATYWADEVLVVESYVVAHSHKWTHGQAPLAVVIPVDGDQVPVILRTGVEVLPRFADVAPQLLRQSPGMITLQYFYYDEPFKSGGIL